MADRNHYRVIILGSGAAGLTAALYTARANLEPLVVEGSQPGGQLTITTDVENYPGFPDGILGPDMMEQFRKQAERFGARIVFGDVTEVEMGNRPLEVQAGKDLYTCDALIIATGATAKRLEVPGAERLWQRGISACAVCDGALPVFRGKRLVVVGGGDTAAEEATFLTRYASSVTMLVRRDRMRASKAMQQRVFANDKIEVSWNTVLTEVLGDDLVAGVGTRNVKSGAAGELEAGGLFFAIGHEPNTAFLAGQLETDATGYLVTSGASTVTGKPGVFACGDVQDKVYRQAVTAAGSGCMAAMEAERYLGEHA